MTAPYMTLVNILLDRAAVPEFKQDKAQPEVLADAVEKLLHDAAARAAQIAAMEEFAQLLGAGGEAPSLRAARILLGFYTAEQLTCACPSARNRARSRPV